jgi:hypothetical protein
MSGLDTTETGQRNVKFHDPYSEMYTMIDDAMTYAK